MALTPPDVAQRIDSISDQLSYKEINALGFNTVSALIVYTGCNINNIIYIYIYKEKLGGCMSLTYTVKSNFTLTPSASPHKSREKSRPIDCFPAFSEFLSPVPIPSLLLEFLSPSVPIPSLLLEHHSTNNTSS
jgi:hypothetical protein